MQLRIQTGINWLVRIKDSNLSTCRKVYLKYMFMEGIDMAPEASDLYWHLAQDMLQGMMTDEVYYEFNTRSKAHELYSDEWYRGRRLSEPFLYVYACTMYYKVNKDPQDADMIFFHLDCPRRAGEYDGKFIFFEIGRAHV